MFKDDNFQSGGRANILADAGLEALLGKGFVRKSSLVGRVIELDVPGNLQTHQTWK